ncbi:unnamed protein product [Mucor fragilis]
MTPNTNNNHFTWNNLPSPVLGSVLHYAQHSRNLILQNNALLLSACQLVCKGWSQVAQEAFYEQVHLGSNALRFLTTLGNAHGLGNLVKTLVFEEGIANHGDMFNLLEDIITHCPNIQELYSLESAVRNDVWTYLISAKKVPQHLRVFTTTTSDATNSPLYSPVALRFKETLTHMQLSFSAILTNNARQGLHYLLSTRLGHFVSLQYLCVDYWQVKLWQDLDTLLNRCPTTLRELVFIHLDLSNNRFPQAYNITPNTNVNHLKIGTSNVSATTLLYFKSKMAVLDKLELLFIPLPDGSIRYVNLWWAYLTKLCTNLTLYNIKFAHFSYQELDQLRNCIKFSLATTANWKDIKSKAASLSFNTFKDDDNVISLFKAWHEYIVYIEFDKVDYLNSTSQWMEIYSPHRIFIKGETMDNQYQMIVDIDATQTQEASTSASRSLLEGICNKTSLHMFFAALSFIAGKNAAALYFDNIVLCYNYSLESNMLRNMQVSTLKFTNSIVQHQALECISKMFVNIDKLTLDTCFILIDDPFQLKICLPYTEMSVLELNINPFVNATSWSPHKKQIYNKCYSLENRDLLRAVAKDGHFMVKIEIQGKTHVFYKQGSDDMKKIDINPDYVEGNVFNFIIFIKCKQLNEVIIKSKHGLKKWNIKFE